MAGDWIKMRIKLRRDGRVLALSRSCHAPVTHVLGALCALWFLADSYAHEDGLLPGYTPDDIDREVELSGFTKSLPEEWCRIEGDRIYLVNYQQHNGETAKRRAQDADRQRRHRDKKNLSRDKRDKSVTREEKRREDIGDESPNTPLAPSPQEADLEPPAVLVFPTNGVGGKTWDLSAAKLEEYRQAFPGIDVLAECRKALQWARDNPAKRKTGRGMAAFLSRWLGKAQDRAAPLFTGSNTHGNGVGRLSRIHAEPGKYDGVGQTIVCQTPREAAG